MPSGAASISTSTDSRTIPTAEASTSTAIRRPASGSASFQPVVRMMTAASITPACESASAATWRSAARTFRPPPDRESTEVDVRLRPKPIAATTRVSPPSTWGCDDSRPIAAPAIPTAITPRTMPLASAARISARLKPNVRRPRRRPLRHRRGPEREPDRARVGEHVARVREQRQAARRDPAAHLGRAHEQCDRERHPQPAPAPVAGSMGVVMVRVLVAGHPHAEAIGYRPRMAKLRLIPQTREFYTLFNRSAANLVSTSRLLLDLLEHYPDRRELVAEIKDHEHEGDSVTHDIVQLVNKTFVTPIDGEDIYDLATALDDVCDFMDQVADELNLYGVDEVPSEAIEQAGVIVGAVGKLAEAIAGLDGLKDISAPSGRHPHVRGRGRPDRARRHGAAVPRRPRPSGRHPVEGHLRAPRAGRRQL